MNAESLAGDYAGFFIALTTLLGLVIGSFLNVVIHRIPIMMQKEWKRDCCELLAIESQQEDGTYNLLKPDSHCPKCKTPIKPWQNIPILSFLLLKGKCNQCSEPISARYPLVELVTGLLSGYIAFSLGYSAVAIAALLLTWTLIALTMIDVDHQLLPDNLTLPLLWLGILVNTQGLFTDLQSSVIGAIAGYLVLWSVFWLFKILTGKEGMGYGDFKLLAALGAWMGWQALPLIIILSSLVGAVIGVAGILIQGRDKNVPIPFGPYLAIAGWIALMWGDQITQGYLRIAGFQN
ncbi:prepilin peptidase [Aestuariicella hydrocarbonica]|uniref:Prepilin leader peptidase/N-methyltransferase n=1 Tax=Pseudomaricurvus hydrocarbonicus TaxID=1470433 RepID=A0A9E5MLP2_9GAMM|nr:A24 family peptidase [Aestuariicella hydrocarbonica]NHO65093.1 prepilin peptidase [Aestuariicella hydrocarbonica]